MSTRIESSNREPGELQTGLERLWNMVREEPSLSRAACALCATLR
ncbi:MULTISPECIES: hypothetical protein [Paenibacillus]|nr:MULTISPECIES: hypothetical protein [Paenibacillus]